MSNSIDSWPEADRPRERLLVRGPDGLSDAELLAVLVGTGDARAGVNAVDIGRALLCQFRSLRGLQRAGIRELQTIPGLGETKVARVKAALELGRRLQSSPEGSPIFLRSSRDVFREYGDRMAHLDQEVFFTLLLDTRNRLIREIQTAVGGLVSVIVQPREVFAPAVKEAAAAVVCIHNHPSGDPTPSASDLELTHRLTLGGRMLGIELIDHVIIGKGRYFSFQDQRCLPAPTSDDPSEGVEWDG